MQKSTSAMARFSSCIGSVASARKFAGYERCMSASSWFISRQESAAWAVGRS